MDELWDVASLRIMFALMPLVLPLGVGIVLLYLERRATKKKES